MMNNIENKDIRIHTLTPVYIGDGTEFQPVSFYIDDIKSELCEFDENALLGKLQEKNKMTEFNSLCQKADIFSLQKLMKLIYDIKPQSFKKVKIAPQIVANYKKCLQNTDKNEINNFGIKKTITSPNTHSAYISGSSLKGALRTGFISNLVKNGEDFSDKKKAEEFLLGSFEKDVFTTLKTSDFTGNNVQTNIAYAVRERKKPVANRSNRSVPVMVESINSGSVFNGSLQLRKDMETLISFENINDILSKTHDYSKSLLKDSKIGINYPLLPKIDEIQEKFKNKTYLCRLGGYIGAESHTIDEYREIEIRNPKKPKDIREYASMALYHSQTKEKTLSDNTTFGWCLLEVLENPNDPVVDIIPFVKA
ncbi:MAG: type III-A CRISPR-associated RAMP protein Csm5 [Endomicrobium sp.]|nr:type III-A CRISPR-associated RAMP protein Csm5 [Endomicrobium sp.]